MEFTKIELEKFELLLTGLKEFKYKIESIDYIHNKKDFFHVMKQFRKFLLSNENGKNYQIFHHSKDYNYYKNFFTEINQYYLRSLESMQTLTIMTKGIHNFSSFYDLLDRELIRESFQRKGKELESLNFEKAKKLVLVGSGTLPETLLYIYENTTIEKIVGIDYNHEAVFMAGEMVSGLKLDNIYIQQYDGTKYDYSDADIVIIPIFASPKEQIINKILSTGKKGVQILVSNPKGLGNMLYEGLEKMNPQGKITHRENYFSSYLAQEIIKLEKYDF